MRTTEYLYDIDPTVLADMRYYEALQAKLACASTLLKTLLETDGVRDEERIEAVAKAMQFNVQLLQELGREV